MVFRFRWTVLLFIILGFLVWAAPTDAQYTPQYKLLAPQSLSCANVRCAGSCTDTPDGPVCGPRLSCANTLCAQGNRCVETQNGPQCLPNTNPYSGPGYYWPRYNYRPYDYRPHYYRPWRRYWRQNWRPPVHRPWTPWYGRGGNYQPSSYEPSPPSEGIACPMIYDPVCGQKIVQCFRAPCPPLQKTFSNSCTARADGFSVLSKGECP